MPRDYQTERDAVIRRWYGGNPQTRNPRSGRNWNEGPITPADCFGVPMQVNSPFSPFGCCMVWRFGLNRDGYAVLTIGGKQELAHRAVFIQTRGQVPEGRQVNHLCNRPYCLQPSHLSPGPVRTTRTTPRSSARKSCCTHPGYSTGRSDSMPKTPSSRDYSNRTGTTERNPGNR